MKKFAWRTIQISLLILTVLGIVKAIFVSLDIDESYAVSAAYRLATGDKLLYDMWEPHQFSALFPVAFLYPFVKLSGSTTYCVIFLRIIGILIHILIAQYIFHVSKDEVGKKGAFLLTVFHLNFLPKWVSMPEFELMHYWSMLLVFLLLYRHEKTGKNPYAAFAGVAFFSAILCYPSMVLLFPFYLIVSRKGKYPIKAPILFTIGTAVPACILSGWVLSYMTPSQIRTFVGYILMDSSHTENPSLKWTRYLWELLDQAKCLGIALGIAAVLTLIAALIIKFAGKKKLQFKKLLLTAVLLCTVLLSIQALYGFVFGDKNQFYLQVRYLVLVVMFMAFAIANYKDCKLELLYGILPSALSLPAVFLITNMDTNTSYAKLMPAIIIGFFALIKVLRSRVEEKNIMDTLVFWSARGAAFSLLLCFFVCKLLLIRVTGCLPVTVKAPMVQVRYGPAAGIFVLDELGNTWNEEYDVIRNFVEVKNNALYIGAEQLFYVAFTKKVSTPSVQGTTVFNEMYGKYYEVFPEKKPQIIVIDETYQTMPGYFYYPENEYIFEWIEKNADMSHEEQIGPYRLLWSE